MVCIDLTDDCMLASQLEYDPSFVVKAEQVSESESVRQPTGSFSPLDPHAQLMDVSQDVVLEQHPTGSLSPPESRIQLMDASPDTVLESVTESLPPLELHTQLVDVSADVSVPIPEPQLQPQLVSGLKPKTANPEQSRSRNQTRNQSRK